MRWLSNFFQRAIARYAPVWARVVLPGYYLSSIQPETK
jgi:hypothetical protein